MRHGPEPSKTSLLVLLNPAGLYDPTVNGYSHVALVAPGARLVHVAGQGGENRHGELQSDFRLQVRQALDNLRVALTPVGAAPSNVARLTLLVVDHTEEKLRVLASELAREWGRNPKPACTLIPVPRLALDGMLVEIDAVAVLPA